MQIPSGWEVLRRSVEDAIAAHHEAVEARKLGREDQAATADRVQGEVLRRLHAIIDTGDMAQRRWIRDCVRSERSYQETLRVVNGPAA